jgi:endoglucanase
MKKITLFLSLLLCSQLFSQELVTNGNFQTGTASPWYGNAANVVDLGAGAFVNQANVTGVGNPYDVNLSQVILLENGKTYQLTFDAFTDATTNSRTMIVGLGQDNAPYAALTSTATLTATTQTFTYQYTINYGDAVSDRVIFDMGAATGFVFIDNVSVIEVTTTCNNGVQDGDETGIDCGGSCPACIPTPAVAAPTPPARPVADVVSIFSDAYANIAVNEWGPNWGPFSARINDFPIESNPTKVMDVATGQVFAGIDFSPALFDATTFTTFHLDYWIADPLPVGQVMSIKLSNHSGGAGETSAIEFVPSPLLTNQWVPLDIPLDNFIPASAPANLSRNAIAQIVITAARADANVPIKIYMDNIYFHKNTVLGVASFDASKIKMYPNPASTVLTIAAQEDIEKVSVLNLLGQEVISATPNNEVVTLDVASLQTGIYVVKTNINGVISSTKFIKE